MQETPTLSIRYWMMLFLILELPDELVDRIVAHLPVCDIPSLALTCQRLYNISLPHYYLLVSISCLAGVGTSEIYNQQRSINVMKALRLDQRKRSGVEKLELRGLYSLVSPFEQASMYVKPFPVHITHTHGVWGRSRPLYIQLVHDLLSLDFPKLDTLVFDMQGLKNYNDFLQFLLFLQRHTQIKTLEVEYDRWMWAERFIFPKNLPILNLAHLEELTIPGHLLPYFLSDRDQGSDACSLRRVHLWWVKFTSDVSGTRSIQDTLRTLASISGNVLRSLRVTVPDNCTTVDATEIIANNFPRLTTLEFCTTRTGHGTMLSNLDLMLTRISRLRHLRRFAYTYIGKIVGDRGFEWKTYKGDSKPWDRIVEKVVNNCPSVDVLNLGSLEWGRRKDLHGLHMLEWNHEEERVYNSAELESLVLMNCQYCKGTL